MLPQHQDRTALRRSVTPSKPTSQPWCRKLGIQSLASCRGPRIGTPLRAAVMCFLYQMTHSGSVRLLLMR